MIKLKPKKKSKSNEKLKSKPKQEIKPINPNKNKDTIGRKIYQYVMNNL